MDATFHPKGLASLGEGIGGLATITASQWTKSSLTDWGSKLSQPHDWTFTKMPSSQLSNPGGVKPEPPLQAWDNGDWPVVVWPALLYAVTPPSSAVHAARP